MQDQSALIIIDMQNDMVDPQSSVRIEGAHATVPALSRLLEFARGKQWPIFHITRSYRENGVDIERPRLKAFEERPYLVPGTRRAEIIAELTPRKTGVDGPWSFVTRQRPPRQCSGVRGGPRS